MIILPTAYLGSVQYYTKLLTGNAVIDLYENYQKQSCRNRADILCANGVMSLTVPVLKPHNAKVLTRDIAIDNSKKWRHQHLHAIISAYSRSPYFEHYEGAISSLYMVGYETLADLNYACMQCVMGLLKVSPNVNFSKEYVIPGREDHDFRSALSHKPRLHKDDPCFVAEEYDQTFSDRFGFVPNLSIIDLLMNEGPSSVQVVISSCRSQISAEGIK